MLIWYVLIYSPTPCSKRLNYKAAKGKLRNERTKHGKAGKKVGNPFTCAMWILVAFKQLSQNRRTKNASMSSPPLLTCTLIRTSQSTLPFHTRHHSTVSYNFYSHNNNIDISDLLIAFFFFFFGKSDEYIAFSFQ